MSRSNQQSCCGVIEEARLQVHERRVHKRQPWIVLKFAVGLTVAVNAYAAYVYVGIFCRDMIVKNQSALGSQALGIVFLTVFCILLLMVSWSYVMVVTTSPGYAINLVKKTDSPGQQLARAQLSSTLDDPPGMSYELLSPKGDPSQNASDTRTKREGRNDRLQAPSTSGKNVNLAPPAAPEAAPQEMVFVLANPETLRVTNQAPLPPENPYQTSLHPPPPMFSRQPSTKPILLPEYRYCSKDKIVKPPRAHHCRACGTCVLKYDHHCPWIGHCVGAFNHKFFVNFVQWAAILGFWIFATLLGLNIKSQRKFLAPDINPQHIAVMALSALFGIFCFLMFMTQVHLIMLNQTTVESLAFRSMKEREQATLAHMHSWYEIRAKRQTQKNWDEEWGRIDKEGNLWWLGSSRENWEGVMGKNVWWWFLPVGHGLQDGLSYPTNPRFDKQGRLRRRGEWPPDLR
ncbi:zf-DHHC-domain-containing protein [Rhizopogon vinicolor AM-OR11-026]|uniref:Palmitoyltransferase n=1 Tax=Rhizopogon vinicolor AM-OR11-026 TaxID=1314800 RepID=A0A1B7MWH6_9AGAM|nr:zf-DHHC-domain-containing protein [Rhizopogon vinicolor AM-OR11-026]